MGSEAIFKAQHKVRLGLSDVSNSTGNVGVVRSKLKKIPTRILLYHLCKISVLNFNEKKSDKIQVSFRDGLLRQGHHKTFRQFDRKVSGVSILIDYVAIVQLLELCRQNPNLLHIGEGESTNKREYLDALGLAFLSMNDVISSVESTEDKSTYTSKMARSYYFRKSDQIRYALPRAWLIFSLLSSQVPKEDYFSTTNAFLEKQGFSLEDYYDAIFCIYANWSIFDMERIDEFYDSARSIDELLAKSAGEKESIKKAIHYLTSDFESNEKFPSEHKRELQGEYIFSHLGLRSKPIIRFQERIFPILIDWIQQLFWNGPFHFVLTEYAGSSLVKYRDQFLHYLGRSTELYVNKLTKWHFPNQFELIDSGNENPLNDGTIKVREDWRLVYEVKAARQTKAFLTADRPIAEHPGFRTMILEGLKQLKDRCTEFIKHSKFSGKITPVLITSGSIPLNDISWKEFEPHFRKAFPIEEGSSFTEVILTDIEGWEVFCASAKGQLEAILKEKLNPEWEHQYLSEFLYRRAIPMFHNGQEPPNEPLVEIFGYKLDLLSSKLFNKSLSGRADGARYLKEVFEVEA